MLKFSSHYPQFFLPLLVFSLSFQGCKDAAVSSPDPSPVQATNEGATASGAPQTTANGSNPGSTAATSQVIPGITAAATSTPKSSSSPSANVASFGSTLGGLIGSWFGSHGGSSTPSSPAPSPANQSSPPVTPSSGSVPSLNAGAAGNDSSSITDYGSALSGNKDNLASILDSLGASAEEKALVIAIAMQETTLMAANQRDASKDGTASANCSILNLNYDMVSKLGYSVGDNGASLNSTGNLSEAVGYLLKAFRTWGVQSTLNYQRGGYTAFKDGVSYGAADYRNAITTIYDKIAGDLSFETDGRRIVVNLQGV